MPMNDIYVSLVGIRDSDLPVCPHPPVSRSWGHCRDAEPKAPTQACGVRTRLLGGASHESQAPGRSGGPPAGTLVTQVRKTQVE